jgi:SAM-dependent methyltransferase
MLIGMSFDKETIATYDRSPERFAEYFGGFGARVKDIDKAFELSGNPEAARVVEIGCGDGRDAVEIVKRAAWYEGFDPSKGLLELARERKLAGNFVEADALSYEFPENLDIVFAFASLLHVSRDDLQKTLGKVHDSLRDGGIMYLSLKRRAEYTAERQEDQYGGRQFYYYDQPTVLAAAGNDYRRVHRGRQIRGGTRWLTLALQKV